MFGRVLCETIESAIPTQRLEDDRWNRTGWKSSGDSPTSRWVVSAWITSSSTLTAWSGIDDSPCATARRGSEVTLRRVTRTAHCIMTTVEQPEVPRDNRILQTIARDNRMSTETMGQLPCAGLFGEVDSPGTVAIGDVLTIDLAADPRPQTG